MKEETAWSDTPLEPRKMSALCIAMVVMLVLLAGVSAWLGWKWTESRQQFRELSAEYLELEREMKERMASKEADVESLMETHRIDLERSNRDWEQRLADQKAREEELRRNSLEAISRIVNESGSTLAYMEDLEARVKQGKELEQAEVTQLKAVASGLAYLHGQYQKPLSEFQELDNWLARQMQVETSPPDDQRKFLASVFSKKYRVDQRQQMADYYKDVGRAEAAETTRKQVQLSYDRAQASMEALKLSSQEYLENLNTIIEGKNASAADMDAFFDISSEILKIHQRVMDVELEEPAPAGGEPLKP